LYGEWLFERREFKQAGYTFFEAKRYPQAMIALEKALEWRAVFDIAMRENMSSKDIIDMAYRISGESIFSYISIITRSLNMLFRGTRSQETLCRILKCSARLYKRRAIRSCRPCPRQSFLRGSSHRKYKQLHSIQRLPMIT
jgi:hypothetical protein